MSASRKFGHVIATPIHLYGHDDARLLEKILVKAMQDLAGDPRERKALAWFNEVQRIRLAAEKQSWIGWRNEAADTPSNKDTTHE
ncbi:hypothetical protein [Sphingomonas sanxanigenens]|uniref:Uncharacterized protein n=1 Tax=Sphingomonas sanxanigenens DSM 19645 = NX02 TaxID=1123269 RepID=W0A3X9_9SPHN|nr:hypothetical protein [Sphingomonas sanxanigenens]AHE52659.1 hypothetical protein NX02_04580 [Sphingomonas sanxanigenens DSM 19645 = NX02]